MTKINNKKNNSRGEIMEKKVEKPEVQTTAEKPMVSPEVFMGFMIGVVTAMVFSAIAVISGLSIAGSHQSFADIRKIMITTYEQEYPSTNTNGMSVDYQTITDVTGVYGDFSELFPEVQKVVYVCHIYIMKIETGITNVGFPHYNTDGSADWGICQINDKTYNRYRDAFIADVLEHARKLNKWEFAHELIYESQDLRNLRLNVAFSLWFAQQLYIETGGRIRDVISRYNSGKNSNHPELNNITLRYLRKFDFYMSRNLPLLISFSSKWRA